MPKLVVIHNPFRPAERDILTVEACRTLADVIDERYGNAIRIDEFYVSRNGIPVDAGEAREIIIGANDYIALVPRVGKGGKKGTLGIIAAIALLTMTMGSGGGLLGGLFGGKMGMGLLILGGLLMGLGKTPKIETPDYSGSSFEADPDWDTGTPITIQGKPIPITYGTVRVRTPQVLSQHVRTEGTHQTLDLLMSGGEGPVDSVSDYFINDQPYLNFTDVAKTGDASRFSEFVPAAAFGYTSIRAGTAVADKVSFKFEFPVGLFLKVGAGSPIEKAFVDVDVEYREAGSGDAFTLYDTWTIEDAYTGKFEAYHDFVPPDTSKIYEFQLTISDMTAGTSTACYWMALLSWQNGGNAAFDYRLGTNDQTVMSKFNDTFAEEGVGLELDTDWTTFQTSGNANEGLEWTLDFPVGLAYFDNAGNTTESWITVDIDYRAVGAADWITHKSEWDIRSARTSNFRISTRIDDLDADQYESRVRINAVHGTGTRYANKCRWQIFSGIIYDDFTRPGKVLVGMTALATDKLQGSIPRVSWTQVRSTVLVFDPTEDGGAGAYVTKAATNPAWICYDLIHRARTVKNIITASDEVQVRGDAHAKIDFQAFSDWADFCDELVDGSARCVANLLVDAAGPLWEIVNRVAVTGRGGIVLRGQTWSVVWDEASDPVQLFTTGNISIDSLTGEFTSGNDRANAVEVTFLNEDRNYERDTLTIFGDDYDDASEIAQPTQIVATGITNYERAYRMGSYRLRLNKYLKRTVSFRADVDAVACQVGDVILLSHDIPRWGESGRLVGCDTAATTLTLDREVTLDPATTYEVMVRLSDDTLVTKTVVSPATATTTNEVEVTVAFSPAPVQFDLYAFGEVDVSAKPFRVTKIARTDDLHVEITALEYYPEVYDESMTVPTIAYSTTLPTVSGVYAVADFDASGQAWLNISWAPPRDGYGGATVLVNGVTIGRTGATSTSISHRIYEDGAYEITVIGLSTSGSQLDKVQIKADVQIISIPIPETVEGVEDTYILRDGTVVTDFDVTYTIPDLVGFVTANRRYPVQRFACVKVSYDPNESGTFIDAGTYTSQTGMRLKNVKADSKIQIKVEVVDKFGNVGDGGLSDVIDITGKSALPDDVTGFSGAQDQYGILLAWDANDDPDIDVYEIRVGASWAAGSVIYSGYTERARLNFTNSGTFTYWIKAKDTSGNYSANAATKAVVVSAPATPVATPTAINGGIKIDIVHTPNVDFDHYVVERKPTDGAWETINSNLRSTTWMDTDIATLGYTTTYEYRVTAVDRNGATGTASDATDATTAKKIETLDITTDQIVAKDFRSAADAGNGAVSGYRIHSGGIEGWNGATKNFCLDGATGTLYAVNACITGTVCATTGVIGGWTVAAGSLSAGNAALCCTGVGVFGTGNDVAVVSAADACYRIWTGHATAACAPFRVTKAGVLTACGGCFNGQITAASGNIGGWLIGATLLGNCCAVLSSCGFIHLGDTCGGCDIVRMDAMDAIYRLWAGHTTAASAPFRVTKAGALTATSATICGAVTATSGAIGGWGIAAGVICSAGGCTVLCCTGLLTGGGYAAGSAGWSISADGAAEFNTITARGAFRASVFQYQEVAAVGGQLLVANAGIVRTAVSTPAGTGSCFTLDVVDPEVGHAAQFAANDILRVQTWNGTALVAAWGTVTAVSDQTTFYRYTVRLESGTSQAIPARAAVVSYGTAAAGGGLLAVGAGTCAPYLDAFTTGATPWTATTVQTRLGNLSGIAGLSGYGLYTNNGNIYGGVVRSNTFDATSGSCFGLAAGVLQLGGTGGGVSKCGMKWDGTTLSIYGAITATSGKIGGFTIAANCIHSYVGGVCTVISSSGDIFGCNIDTALLRVTYGEFICSGASISWNYNTTDAAYITKNCLWTHQITGCTFVTSPIVCGSTCVTGPVVCGTTSVSSPILCATTCVQSPIICASCCVTGPVVCANCMLLCATSSVSCTYFNITGCMNGTGIWATISNCLNNGYGEYDYKEAGTVIHYIEMNGSAHESRAGLMRIRSICDIGFYTGGTNERVRISSAGAVTACVSLSSPILCGTTCAISPIAIGSTCVCSPILCATTCVTGAYIYGAGNIYSCTCVCAPALIGSSCVCSSLFTGLSVCTTYGHFACCLTTCAGLFARSSSGGGIAVRGCVCDRLNAFSGMFTGGSFCVALSSTSCCFTVCNVTTGSGTAAHILATGQLVCQSSTRASKCCIAPWELPTDFLDRFEPARFLYRSGLNSGSPFLVGALADDLAPWAPWAVRCDAQGNPATVSDTSLAVAALSGIKIERDERRSDVRDLWSCICALELALAKAR